MSGISIYVRSPQSCPSVNATLREKASYASPALCLQWLYGRNPSGKTAKLTWVQLRKHVGGKGLRWLLLPAAYVFICRKSIPGSTSGYVAGSSAAYENQALEGRLG